MSENINQ